MIVHAEVPSLWVQKLLMANGLLTKPLNNWIAVERILSLFDFFA